MSLLFVIINFLTSFSFTCKDSIIDYLVRDNDFNKAENVIKYQLRNDNTSEKKIYLNNQLTGVMLYKGDIDSAIYYINKSLLLLNQTSNHKLLSDTWLKAGEAYALAGIIDSSYYFIRKTIDYARLYQMEGFLPQAYNTFGHIRNSVDDHLSALNYFLLAYKLSLKGDDPYMQTICLYNIGITYSELNHSAESLNYLKQAAAKAYKHNFFHQLIYIYYATCNVYKNIQDIDKYNESLDKAESLSNFFGNKRTHCLKLRLLTEDAIQQNDYNSAIKYAEEALSILSRTCNPAIKEIFAELIGKAYKSKNDYKNALIYYELCASLKDSIISKINNQDMINLTNELSVKPVLLPKGLKKGMFDYFLLLIFILAILFAIIYYSSQFVRQFVNNVLLKMIPGIFYSNQGNVANLHFDVQTMINKSDTLLTNKYKHVTQKEEKYNYIYQHLINLIEMNELYKNPTLCQDEVVKILYTNKRYLYLAIKQNADTNFKGLINKYRIEEAKRVLTEKIKNGEEFALSDIFSKCGFSSNESFYRTFKTHTDITPGQYVEQLT